MTGSKGKRGIIYNKIVVPPQFDVIKFCSTSKNATILTAVKKDGKWTYINKYGKLITQPQFDSVDEYFYSGVAKIIENNKIGFINENGKIITKPQFDGVTPFDDCGFAGVNQKGKWGFIDKSGKLIIKPQFEEISNLQRMVWQE